MVEPGTGDVLAEIDTASPVDVDDAVAAANAAAPELERLSFFERADLLGAVAARLEAGASPLAEQLARESGKALAAEAVDELAESADIFRLAAEEAEARAVAAGADPGGLEIVEREDLPLAYLPGDARRVRVRVVGEAA